MNTVVALAMAARVLCSVHSSDYDHSSVGVPICRRHVTPATKRHVFEAHGIAPAARRGYVIDHLVPLCMGGNNSMRNLRPEPLRESRERDVIERRACAAMDRGELTQAEAIQMVMDQ